MRIAKNCIKTVTPLSDVCTVVVDNDNVIMLEFDKDPVKLVSTGVLDGSERYYKITKRHMRDDVIYNSITFDTGKVFTFYYGGNASTCISRDISALNKSVVDMLKTAGYKNIY